ncbi:MAG: molybdenum cofactor guanylyltransferase [Actinomycetota bacterium]
MLAGIVLCGGGSSRMGRDKALLDFEGEPLIVRVTRRLSEVADPVFVASGGRRYPVDLEHIDDAAPDSGPLGGIVAGLRASPHGLLAVVAVDMPFASPSLFTHLAGRHAGSNVVVPEDEHGLQPLHAVYSKTALPHLEQAVGRRDLSLLSVIDRLKNQVVTEWETFDPTGRFALNVNEPGDLRYR